MNGFLGLLIESLVAVLLVLTIGYCMVLNRRIKRLRADESSMRATIGELLNATENAHRAISELKTTVQDGDRALGERLRGAEEMSERLAQQLERGEVVLSRIMKIAGAVEGISPAVHEPPRGETGVRRASETAAAAQAIASRARSRAERAA